VFDTEIQSARAALADTPHKPYEAALVTLGELAGAVPSEGDGGNDAAPDTTWIFADASWGSWEAKSEANEEPMVSRVLILQRFTARGHQRLLCCWCISLVLWQAG
jgi:hypothetical protein